MNIRALFSAHPTSVGESYGEHMENACRFGSRMILAGFACLIHGLLPFLFVKTGSRTIAELNERMLVNRSRKGAAASPPARRHPIHS
jgi:hypothetical protein